MNMKKLVKELIEDIIIEKELETVKLKKNWKYEKGILITT